LLLLSLYKVCCVSDDSGGRLISVTGSYLDVIQHPVINLDDRRHKFSSNVRALL